jgi:ribosomal protein S18 acetylase RimI-like enzyme
MQAETNLAAFTANCLEFLPWDSGHFGFAVARIAPTATAAEVAAALGKAREQGVRLVYWLAAPGVNVAPGLLRRFTGRPVGKRATYRLDLPAQGSTVGGETPSTYRVRSCDQTEVSPALRHLALEAGSHSRFAVDPFFPRERFVSLYTTWIERSVRGELADAVLVAEDVAVGALLGMVTVAAAGEEGNIGLIAVEASARGQGIGRRLLDSAGAWLLAVGARQVTVVTQEANRAACRLYEKAGYRTLAVESWYHFWPQREGL